MVSVDVKQHLKKPRSCVKVEVALMGFPCQIVLMVSVDVNQEVNLKFNSANTALFAAHLNARIILVVTV